MSLLLQALSSSNCPITSPSFYQIGHCDGAINGGFQIDQDGIPSVLLCSNHILDQETMDRTVTHELIHAYDTCTNNVDWNNCQHLACTEVRAASLSGDCNWKYEFLRSHFNLAGQHQVIEYLNVFLERSF